MLPSDKRVRSAACTELPIFEKPESDIGHEKSQCQSKETANNIRTLLSRGWTCIER